MKRTFLACAILLLSATGIASVQETGAEAMKRLAFLAGSWSCTIRGGQSDGVILKIRYSFSPDGLWMSEVSGDADPGNWATQIWGYDLRTRKLEAYQFLKEGAFTKTVDGWQGGSFVSHRDDNGAAVALKPVNDKSMVWTIASADGSSVVREECSRI